MEELNIREAHLTEWDDAMELAFKVFLRFEAKEYGKKGTEAFAEFVTDVNLKKAFETGHYKVFCAFSGEEMIGIVGVRNGNHVSLLFVKEEYHRKGVGRELLNTVRQYLKDNTEFSRMTVNAAPIAAEFYHRCGFKDTAKLTEKDGISYIPMELEI